MNEETAWLKTVNYKNEQGQTSLHLAAQKEDMRETVELVERLLLEGLKIDEQDEKGNTALHYAFQKNNQPLILVLCAQGADLYLKNNEGIAPIHHINTLSSAGIPHE